MNYSAFMVRWILGAFVFWLALLFFHVKGRGYQGLLMILVWDARLGFIAACGRECLSPNCRAFEAMAMKYMGAYLMAVLGAKELLGLKRYAVQLQRAPSGNPHGE